MSTKPLAKSLHTVTVIVRVAKALRPLHPNSTPEQQVELALMVLGYVDAADPYGLAQAALKQLEA